VYCAFEIVVNGVAVDTKGKDGMVYHCRSLQFRGGFMGRKPRHHVVVKKFLADSQDARQCHRMFSMR
jgi:hypothetical protein